jgi:hypothetical protein
MADARGPCCYSIGRAGWHSPLLREAPASLIWVGNLGPKRVLIFRQTVPTVPLEKGICPEEEALSVEHAEAGRVGHAVADLTCQIEISEPTF